MLQWCLIMLCRPFRAMSALSRNPSRAFLAGSAAYLRARGRVRVCGCSCQPATRRWGTIPASQICSRRWAVCGTASVCHAPALLPTQQRENSSCSCPQTVLCPSAVQSFVYSCCLIMWCFSESAQRAYVRGSRSRQAETSRSGMAQPPATRLLAEAGRVSLCLKVHLSL